MTNKNVVRPSIHSIFDTRRSHKLISFDNVSHTHKSISAWINSRFLFPCFQHFYRSNSWIVFLFFLFFFSLNILLSIIVSCCAASDIERCPVGDTNCIRTVSNKVLEINGRLGHNGINLLPIDPLHIPNIGIKQGAESPVNIELKFKDVDLVGLAAHKFVKLT